MKRIQAKNVGGIWMLFRGEKSLRAMSERFNKKTEECCYDSYKLLVAVDLAGRSWGASFDSCSQTADVFIWAGLL